MPSTSPGKNDKKGGSPLAKKKPQSGVKKTTGNGVKKVSPIENYVIEIARKKRLSRRLSTEQLSIQMGKTKSWVGDVESPKRRAKYNLNHINELAEIFDCSPGDFLPKMPLPAQGPF